MFISMFTFSIHMHFVGEINLCLADELYMWPEWRADFGRERIRAEILPGDNLAATGCSLSPARGWWAGLDSNTPHTKDQRWILRVEPKGHLRGGTVGVLSHFQCETGTLKLSPGHTHLSLVLGI